MTCPACQGGRLCRTHSIQWVEDFARCKERGPCAQSLPRSFCAEHLKSHGGLSLRFTEWPPWSLGHAWRWGANFVLDAAGVVVALAVTVPLYVLDLVRAYLYGAWLIVRSLWASLWERDRTTPVARWFWVEQPIEYVFFTNSDPDVTHAIVPPGQHIGENLLTMRVGASCVRALLASGAIRDTGDSFKAPAAKWPFSRFAWPDERSEEAS